MFISAYTVFWCKSIIRAMCNLYPLEMFNGPSEPDFFHMQKRCSVKKGLNRIFYFILREYQICHVLRARYKFYGHVKTFSLV